MNKLEQKQLTMKAAKIIEAYNAMEVQAVALGPLDFAAGFDRLMEYGRAAKFPLLCANLLAKETGQPVFQASIVVQEHGVKAGVIGVLDSGFSLPKSDPWAEKVRLAPIHPIVKKLAKRLRDEGCGIVVVLSSLEPKKLRLLAKGTEGVDLFIGGDPMDKLVLPYGARGSLIACSSQLGKYVGHVALTLDERGSVAGMKHSFVAMKPEQRDDPTVRRIVDGYYKAVALLRRNEPAMYVKEAEETVNLQHDNPVFVSSEECRNCHGAEYRKWKATKHAQALANLPAAARDNIECLECHVTGFGKWGGFSGLRAKPDLSGIQCEECHGPGSSHPATLAMTRGKAVQAVCKRCHTRSRSPDFDLREYLSRIACRPG
ncbi:MAG: hypothetical protein HY900_05470 [Deltaproteobacteria bacterium]|nr:hypothetical protein [Deltaproteobacteria bacterium]